MVSYLCAAAVGVVFLATGTLKLLDAYSFLKHVDQYRLIPPRLVGLAAVLFIGLELALGAALLLGISGPLLPGAMLLFVFFAALTIWGTSTGRVEDCGCYGGYLLLTPWQSVALDGGYLILLSLSWYLRPAADSAIGPLWKWAIFFAVLVAGAGFSIRSARKPLFRFRFLKEGKAWNPGWLKNSPRDLGSGSHFLVFLSKDCPHCKRWVPLLNVLEVQPDLPGVMGIMSLNDAQRQQFLSEHMIRFPIIRMHKGLLSLLARAVPTAVLLENGIIARHWEGEMPESYLERIRGFFGAIQTRKTESPVFSG
jgi:hypothetical protein